jgi:hypothetical protein
VLSCYPVKSHRLHLASFHGCLDTTKIWTHHFLVPRFLGNASKHWLSTRFFIKHFVPTYARSPLFQFLARCCKPNLWVAIFKQRSLVLLIAVSLNFVSFPVSVCDPVFKSKPPLSFSEVKAFNISGWTSYPALTIDCLRTWDTFFFTKQPHWTILLLQHYTVKLMHLHTKLLMHQALPNQTIVLIHSLKIFIFRWM